MSQVVFSVCCIEYGQGDCHFTLISEEDLKEALAKLHPNQKMEERSLWYNCDPLPITDLVPIERKAFFTDIKDMLLFIKEHNITIKYSLHGDIY